MKLNNVVVAGRCGNDIEIKKISDKFSVGTFSICTDESYKNKAGEWVNPANWINIKVVNPNDFLLNIVKKGSEVMVLGKLKNEEWVKDGVNHNKLIVESNWQSGGSVQATQRSERAEQVASHTVASQPKAESIPQGAQAQYNDDLPF